MSHAPLWSIAHGDRAAALIIAGGRGTRFWPAARERRPKPLFAIDGRHTLLSETIARTCPLIPHDRIFVLVAAAQRAAFAAALHGLIPARNLLTEPAGRGTAVAIAYGCGLIGARLGGGIVAVMPADHYIAPPAGFRRTLAVAIRLAAERKAIVVIGVPPTGVEPGYGHMKFGAPAGAGFAVERFVEKPPLKLARRMTGSKKYFWNAGLFVMDTATLARELKEHCPRLLGAAARLTGMPKSCLAKTYLRLDFDAFDREVLEKSANVLGVRAQFKWYDVGSWQGLWQALRGGRDTVTTGGVVVLKSKNVLARAAAARQMVLLGVEDLAAIDTGDAILIARLSRAQDVRLIAAELARRGLHKYL